MSDSLPSAISLADNASTSIADDPTHDSLVQATTEPLLWWESSIFGVDPTWAVDVSLSDARRAALKALAHLKLPTSEFEVTFVAKGAFNQVYQVVVQRQGDDPIIFVARVALPVDENKVRSEFATLSFVRQLSQLVARPLATLSMSTPTPKLESLSLEWLFLDWKSGAPAEELWDKIDWSSKEAAVRALADDLLNPLFNNRQKNIGNLYIDLDGGYSVGPIVSREFFWGRRPSFGVTRGPFATSREWMQARLDIIRQEQVLLLDQCEDEEDRPYLERTLKNIQRLLRLVDHFFPPPTSPLHPESEPTTLFHHDLNWHNFLLTPDGTVSGVIDWEFASTLPLWWAAKWPEFLDGKECLERPDAARYHPTDGQQMYREQLRAWEKTQLCLVFAESMSEEWRREHEGGQLLRELDEAIGSVTVELMAKDANRIIEKLEKAVAIEVQS